LHVDFQFLVFQLPQSRRTRSFNIIVRIKNIGCADSGEYCLKICVEDESNSCCLNAPINGKSFKRLIEKRDMINTEIKIIERNPWDTICGVSGDDDPGIPI